MKKEEIAAHIDHTVLNAVTTWKDIEKLCKEALQYKTASVCIPPSFVERAKYQFPTLTICTVIGFPMGYQTVDCKVFETKEALEHGADEIDMVINLGYVKNKEYEELLNEIKAVKHAAGNKVVKVIIETCYLSDDEKKEVCVCINKAKADFIKTSTGFGIGGAKLEDIRLFKQYLDPDIKIKASGGIRNQEQMEAFLAAGCDRLGCSCGISVLFASSC